MTKNKSGAFQCLKSVSFGNFKHTFTISEPFFQFVDLLQGTVPCELCTQTLSPPLPSQLTVSTPTQRKLFIQPTVQTKKHHQKKNSQRRISCLNRIVRNCFCVRGHCCLILTLAQFDFLLCLIYIIITRKKGKYQILQRVILNHKNYTDCGKPQYAIETSEVLSCLDSHLSAIMPHSSVHLSKTSSCYGIVIKLQE